MSQSGTPPDEENSGNMKPIHNISQPSPNSSFHQQVVQSLRIFSLQLANTMINSVFDSVQQQPFSMPEGLQSPNVGDQSGTIHSGVQANVQSNTQHSSPELWPDGSMCFEVTSEQMHNSKPHVGWVFAQSGTKKTHKEGTIRHWFFCLGVFQCPEPDCSFRARPQKPTKLVC